MRFVKDSPVRARPFRRQQTVVPARTRVKLLCGLAVPGNHPTSFVDRHRRHTLFSFAVVNHRFMGNSFTHSEFIGVAAQRLAHHPQASRAQRGEACRVDALVGRRYGLRPDTKIVGNIINDNGFFAHSARSFKTRSSM